MRYNIEIDYYRVGRAPILVTSQEDVVNRVKELIRKGKRAISVFLP